MNMACGTGFCAGKIIAVLVVASAGGLAAYNYTTTGTLFGNCSLEDETTETQVSYEQSAVAGQTDEKGACHGTDAAEEVAQVAAKDGSGCSTEKKDMDSCSKTGETAMASAAKMAGDCTREMDAAITEAAATTGSHECEDTGVCPMTGEPVVPENCPMNSADKDCDKGGDKDCSTADKKDCDKGSEKAENCHGETAATEEVAAASEHACETTGVCPKTGEPVVPENCPMNSADKDCSTGADKDCSTAEEKDCDKGSEKAKDCNSQDEEEVAASDAADDTDG